jgi:hypothetical protein
MPEEESEVHLIINNRRSKKKYPYFLVTVDGNFEGIRMSDVLQLEQSSTIVYHTSIRNYNKHIEE